MYDIQRESGEEYLDHYIYKSRNECNQIIVCEVYRTYNETLNFAFYVTTKWKFPGDSIEVYPDDERRRKVYEYALLPLGFKIMKDKYKTLIYKL